MTRPGRCRGRRRGLPDSFRRLLPAAAALLPLLLLWPALRGFVESRMSLHMLLEWPLLFAAGWSASRLGERHRGTLRLLRAAALLDWRGWTGATLVSGVAAVWMLPSALDATLLSGGVAVAKTASWWVAGFVFAGSCRRMDPELLLFFVGNLAWMTASAGLLYLDAPARLCVNYLQDDQRHAGIGLVLLALGLGGLALRRAMGPGAPLSPAVATPKPVAPAP